MFNYNNMKRKDLKITTDECVNIPGCILKRFKGTEFTRRDIRKLVKEQFEEIGGEEFNIKFQIYVCLRERWINSGEFILYETPIIKTNYRMSKDSDINWQWDTVNAFNLFISSLIHVDCN
jgi:hypothetical protein